MRPFFLFCALAALSASCKEVSPFVRSDGAGGLTLAERPYRFLGVNIYSLSSRPAPHFHCGRVFTDAEVDATMAEVKAMGGDAIRFMAFQPFTRGGEDWARTDLIMSLARKHGLRLVVTLDSQWGACTGEGYRAAEWYRVGYRHRPAAGPSFREYVKMAVRRYRDEPAVLMWQVMNEAESRASKDSGPDDPMALYAFAVDMTSLIRSIDKNHLVSFGTIGDGRRRSGAEGSHYSLLHSIPSIDIVEAHLYPSEPPTQIWPSAEGECLDAADTFGKPCVIGEIGLTATTPHAKTERAKSIVARMRDLWSKDVAGILIWSYRSGDHEKDFDPSDPLYGAFRDFASRRE